MISLLKQRNFALLWTGGLISFIGDWIILVAMPIYIYNLTGSVMATGAAWIARLIPSLILGPLAGVYVDRWDRRHTMIATNLLALPLFFLLLLVQSAEMVWIAYVVLFLMGIIRQFMGPAENALLPKLVSDEDLPTANALNSLNNNLARLVGPAIGGVVYAQYGFNAAVLLDAASFLAAAVLIGLISAPESVTRATMEEGEPAAEGATAARTGFWQELLDGMRVVRNTRVVAALFVFLGIACLAEGFFTVLIVVYVEEMLRGGATELGWLMTAQAAGGLLGGLFIGRVAKKARPSFLIALGMIVAGIGDILIFNIPVLALNLTIMVLIGIPVVGLHTGLQTLMQRNVADRFRGRVMAAFETVISLSVFVSTLVATFFGTQANVVALLTLGSSFYLMMGIAAMIFFARSGEGAPAVALREPAVVQEAG